MTKQLKKEAAVHGPLMPPPAAAQYLGGIVTGTLAKWRHFGGGPEYVRIGSRIFYEKTTLDAYIAARRRSSTSEGIVMRQRVRTGDPGTRTVR